MGRPDFAMTSACEDSNDPSRAIESALVKVGVIVASTHKSGNLWFLCRKGPQMANSDR